MSDLIEIRDLVRQFAADRDWDQFHSPKNLAMALSVEAAELLEHFQWLSQAQSAELPAAKRKQVAQEMSDVLVYLVRLADKLDIDLLQETKEKLVLNGEKYPAELVRGSAKKYTEY
ncbi:MAG: NTP pyrophosphatase (non-canonical NTP hydrolase) [Pseudohongiellaceae bacterium]|jgi:NTP pyrophosphatase (non-canonical NTP hydrolase)